MRAADVTCKVVGLDAESPDDLELLSADERTRAGRLQLTELRRRYVVGRAAVRRVLADAVSEDPRSLTFEYSENGRPDLAGHPEFSFNFSGSGAVGIVAISTAGRVGVDVEVVRAGFADLRIAERSFAAGEVAHLRALPDGERDVAFLRCWTRKEALLKGVGGGLTLPLKGFEVSVDGPARVIDAGSVLRDGSWELTDVSELVPGHVAALALDRLSGRGSPQPAE